MGKGTRFIVTVVILVCFNFFMLAREAKAECYGGNGNGSQTCVEQKSAITPGLIIIAIVLSVVVLGIMMNYDNDSPADKANDKANLLNEKGKQDKLEYLVVADGTFSLVRW